MDDEGGAEQNLEKKVRKQEWEMEHDNKYIGDKRMKKEVEVKGE
jgi:hypothetical protein